MINLLVMTGPYFYDPDYINKKLSKCNENIINRLYYLNSMNSNTKLELLKWAKKNGVNTKELMNEVPVEIDKIILFEDTKEDEVIMAVNAKKAELHVLHGGRSYYNRIAAEKDKEKRREP